MSDHAPAPTDQSRSRDSTFLLVIAVLALVCGALSFYLQRLEDATPVTATASDEAPAVPLPAGPRKYQ